VRTDNAATSVNVSQVGSNIRISEVGTNRMWDYAASQVGRVDFVGAAGNDRFVNYVYSLPVRAWGLGGNDYLEGYNGADTLVGGDGHDTLVGYGGNDQMWGGYGDDVLRGMAGNDQLMGEAGNDHLDGGADNDQLWGGDGADILLGGIGNDDMWGEAGNDRLNGQGGIDRMWAGDGNDVLVAIDAAYNELVDSGTGADIMWIDGYLSGLLAQLDDDVIAASASDVVQRVSSFANGADKTLDGDNITDPTATDWRHQPGAITLEGTHLADNSKLRYNNVVTAGNTQGSNPLFSQSGSSILSANPALNVNSFASGGPRSADINQGDLGDCWLLAGLGAVANQNQNIIRQNVVDFDDGTYGVRLGNKFYRVDNELPVWDTANGATSANVRFAKLGAQDSMWVAIVEKAYAHFRYGTNTYDSLQNPGGRSTEVFEALRMKNVAGYGLKDTYATAAAMATDLYSKWTQGYAIVIGSIAFNGPEGGNHAFTIERFIRNAAGIVTDIVLRNPWGEEDGINRFNAFAFANPGASANDGVFTVTVSQLYNSGGWVRTGQV
jgi:hypothetical protein